MGLLAKLHGHWEEALTQHAGTLMLLVVCSASVTAYALWLGNEQLSRTARAEYVQSAHQGAQRAASEVSEAFRSVYRTLRTIARLPGVRGINKHADHLSADAHLAMRELYLNLADTIDVSEIYVVPRDFDPERVDARTGQKQKPAITFDDNIVGRHAGDASLVIEEIEIHEYRVMVTQIAHFANRFPSDDAIVKLGYPGIGSAEVITCDNRRYSPDSADDKDRSGYVYSVPFYRDDGTFAGIVSAVMLTSSIGRLLPGANVALKNRAHAYTIVGPGTGQARISAQWVEQGLRDPSLIYSEIIPLTVTELGTGWTLWSGRPNRDYDSSAQKLRERILLWLGFPAITLVALALVGFIATKASQTQTLERRVDERTRELAQANQALNAARERERRFTGDAAHELRTPLTALSTLAQAALSSADPSERDRRLEQIQLAVSRAGRLIEQLLALARIDPLESADMTRDRLDIVRIARDTMIDAFDEAERANITLSMSAPDEAWILGDADLLRIMLQNLVSNALQHTGNKGTIALSLEAADTTITLNVDDDGPGIPAEFRTLVLRRFFRVPGGKRPGSGLGLSIVVRIAELLGGTVAVDASPTIGGARLSVLFQRVDAPAQPLRISSIS